jgi:hypothetical protein
MVELYFHSTIRLNGVCLIVQAQGHLYLFSIVWSRAYIRVIKHPSYTILFTPSLNITYAQITLSEFYFQIPCSSLKVKDKFARMQKIAWALCRKEKSPSPTGDRT